MKLPFHLRLHRRHFHLQEFQSKSLLASHGLRTQRFQLVKDACQVPEALAALDASQVVVKAQVLAGGRGKGHFPESGLRGGVHIVKAVPEGGKDASHVPRVTELVQKMIGNSLVTHQTGPDGLKVQHVMLADGRDLQREMYVAIALDRQAGGIVLVASPAGGVDIEQVPEAMIRKYPILPGQDNAVLLAEAADFILTGAETHIRSQLIDQLSALVNMFTRLDATLIEINPLGLTPENELLCFDAKLEFDESAVFRQRALFNWLHKGTAEPEAATTSPAETSNTPLMPAAYVKMDGDIGCLVNGAGLAMATMDLISHLGGRPANFLDIGGGAEADQIAASLRLLMDDPAVRCVFINVFGGIMRGDVVAEGIAAAIENLRRERGPEGELKPIVVRLVGTNAEQGMRILSQRVHGIAHVVTCEDAEDAARLAISTSP